MNNQNHSHHDPLLRCLPRYVSFILCLAMLNVRSACAVMSLSKIPLTQTEYVKTFPGKVSCYDLSFCPSWNLNTAEMETNSWHAVKQETRLVGDMKQSWRCCKTPGSPVSLLMKVKQVHAPYSASRSSLARHLALESLHSAKHILMVALQGTTYFLQLVIQQHLLPFKTHVFNNLQQQTQKILIDLQRSFLLQTNTRRVLSVH
jgi:hypothetical protein